MQHFGRGHSSRQERHDRSRHRGGRRRRDDVSRARVRAISRSSGAGGRTGRKPFRPDTARAGCSIRSTARRTTRTACRSSVPSLALEIDGVAEVAAVFDPTRQELFTAERGNGAFLNGRPIRVSPAEPRSSMPSLVTGFPYDVHGRVDEIVGLFGASSAGPARCAASARPRSISVMWPPDAWTASGRAT